MRILVLSDSHRGIRPLHEAIAAQPTAEVVIHLGDSEIDLTAIAAQYPEKMFVSVLGNCDWGIDLPTVAVKDFCGVRLFCTHGHRYGVKSGLETAKAAAREAGAQVLLYGHTHQAVTDYDNGLYVVNPGALKGIYPSYATLDLTEQGIVSNIIAL